MKIQFFFLPICFLFSFQANGAPPSKKYHLAWSDDFDGKKLDTLKWEYRQPGPRRDAINTKDAVSLDGKGHLVLTTKKAGGKYYTAMIGTQGKFEQRFGYFECRVKLQTQLGHWSAFWLQSPTLGKTGDVKKNGTEIDIFEYLSKNKTTILHNLHWDGYGKLHKHIGSKIIVPELNKGFHTIGLEWTPEEYVFYVDGKKTWRTTKAVSHRKEYIILSLEVGKWAGKIADAKLPDHVYFDYVRVYNKQNKGAAEQGAPGNRQNAANIHKQDGQVWPSQPPADCPFQPSKEITGILFTTVHSDYHCGDTWYPSWASDNKLYSPWTDGRTDGVGSSSGGKKATTGNAVLTGDNPLKLVIKNTSQPQHASPWPYQGRYPCGSLVYNGVWYYGTYCLGPAGRVKHGGMTWNWPVLGPMPGFRISTDYGKTWTPSPLSPGKPLFPEPEKLLGPVKMGCPHFVDFGKNMEHSPDGLAYLVGMGAETNDPKPRYANLSWITADQVYVARVKPGISAINDIRQYEFYAGHGKAGKPFWTHDFSKIKPLLEWNNNMGCVTVTYDAPLRKYLMCITDGWPTVSKMNSYILESNSITGPWKLVVYMKDFGEQGYFLNFPSKFISDDGRTLWLCFSANFSSGWNGIKLKFNPQGGRYGLCLHEVKLLTN